MSEPTDFPALSRGRFRSVRRLLERKGRQAVGEFLIEGPQAVRAALASEPQHPLLHLVVSELAAQRHAELVASCVDQGVEVLVGSADDLRSLTDAVHPQGVVAVCRQVRAELDAVLAAGPKLLAVCSQIRDPGNLGTLIRSADAFGADAVLISKDSVELYNPKVLRATVGSLFNLPVVAGLDLVEAIGACRQAGVRVLAADGGAARTIVDVDLTPPTAWLLGNEARGLSPTDAALADEIVSVPLYGRAESLNLAAAATVCLYATASAQH